MQLIRIPSPVPDAPWRALIAHNELKTGHKGLASTIVAKDGDQEVGGAFFWWYGPDAVIEVFAIDTAFRGQGIGEALLAAAEADLIEAGCLQVIVSTTTFQAPNFYEKFGYERISVTPEFLGGCDLLTYRKKFSR